MKSDGTAKYITKNGNCNLDITREGDIGNGAVTGNVRFGSDNNSNQAFIAGIANGAWSASNRGLNLDFNVTDNGKTEAVRSMRLTNRNVLIGLATAENDNIGGTGHPNIVQIKGNGTGQGLVVGNSAGAGRINIHDRRGENTITNGNELAFIGLGGGSPGINRAAIRAFADFESQDNAQRRGGELRLCTA